MSDLRDLYQEVIIDHNRHPRNFHEMPHANHRAEGFNPLCGDQLMLYLYIEDNIIQEVSFTGSGCAISTASASLMTEALLGKTVLAAEQLFTAFHDVMMNQTVTSGNDLGKLTILTGVREFPARVKCATLPWHALQAALHHEVKSASTE